MLARPGPDCWWERKLVSATRAGQENRNAIGIETQCGTDLIIIVGKYIRRLDRQANAKDVEYKEKGLDQNLKLAVSFDMNRQYTSFSMALLACLSHANIDEEFFSEIMHHDRELYLLLCVRCMNTSTL